MIYEFTTLRDEVVNITNEHLESWNKEFDTCVGDMGEDNTRYNEWIAEKFNEVCKVINKNHPECCIEIKSEPEMGADFVGYCKWNESLSVFMTLEEQV